MASATAVGARAITAPAGPGPRPGVRSRPESETSLSTSVLDGTRWQILFKAEQEMMSCTSVNVH